MSLSILRPPFGWYCPPTTLKICWLNLFSNGQRHYSHILGRELPIDHSARLSRRLGRLKTFMGRLQLPKPTCFVVGNQTYALPTRQQQVFVPASDYHKHDLQYLAGFFDGDGCVSVATDASGCSLQVSQTISSPQALLALLRCFGGTIYVCQAGRGAARHKIKWSVSGKQCQNAAQALVGEAFVKRPQLAIAADWPSDKQERKRMRGCVSNLKRTEHIGEFNCSWPYLAGFFDAEGHIKVSPHWASMQLDISQKYAPVLTVIQKFVQNELPEANVSLHSVPGVCYRLSVTNTPGSKRALRKLLASSLLQKRRQAEIAVNLDRENHAYVRSALGELSGNQGRYRRLDEKGQEISLTIHRTRKKLFREKRSGKALSAVMTQAALHAQVAHRNAHKMNAQIELYRKDIRNLLRSGAALVSFSQTKSQLSA